MTFVLAATTAWLLAGGALAAGLYWLFLITPESTVWTLGISALLLLVLYVVVAVTLNAALLATHRRTWSVGAIARGALGIPALAPSLLLLGLIWWTVGAGVGWVERNQGPISAVFIARLGWSDVTILFTATEWAGAWLRWVAAPLIALVWLRQILTDHWRPGWPLVREGLSPLGLLVATVAFCLLVYLPWTYLVPWRPRWAPTGTLEPLFIAAKLGAVAVLAALGAAVTMQAAAGRSNPSV